MCKLPKMFDLYYTDTSFVKNFTKFFTKEVFSRSSTEEGDVCTHKYEIQTFPEQAGFGTLQI